MNTRQVLLTILLLLVIATGWYLQQERDTEGRDSAAGRKGIDMFAQQLEVAISDKNGRPEYRIQADHLSHSPATERFDLTRPQVEISPSNGAGWNIASERGQMNDKGDRLWLLGEVNIHRRGNHPLHIKTSDLLIQPDEQLAETEREATVSSAQYRINAIGMKADFRKGLLEFRSRVRGTINAAG